MLFELIATVVAGFAGAGCALILNKLIGGRLPRWIMPVAAGAAMLGTAIANEYGWYARTAAGLPEGLEVAMTVEDRAIYRPWGYLFPFVSRFLAVDTANARTHASRPGQKLVDVYAFGRWSAPQSRPVMVDCAGGRRADIPPGTTIAPDGSFEGLVWRETGADDEVVATVCREG